MYLDVAIAKLIEADHSHNIDVKNDLLEILKKYHIPMHECYIYTIPLLFVLFALLLVSI